MTKVQFINDSAQVLQENKKTYAGETVKSIEEATIANFLYLHGVTYRYEANYPFDTRDEEHVQYRPDFYLPDYDIYIEHFGVNQAMKTPWLSEIEEKKYVDGMVWKRMIHQKYNTTLIESFSYYHQNGILLERLEENLLAHGVRFREIDYQDIFSAVFDQTNNNYLREFIQLLRTFISLFKSNNYSEVKFEEFRIENRKKQKNHFLRKRTELFFDMIQPIYKAYQQRLIEIQAVDFHDMINVATDIVRLGKVSLPYKYIIIDEYQDIATSRYQLIKAIKDQTNAKVMCVGDDWQSIYRFAGSDIELFSKFEKYFGKYELIRIEKTYRNAQDIIDIAGRFMMQNPHQYRKNLISDKRIAQPVQIFGYQQNILEALEKVLHAIVQEYGETAEIMLLGRNNFDVSIFDKSPFYSKKEDRQAERLMITYQPLPRLTMYFLTVHRSKGLEADNVIVINAADSLTGFPNKITDDPVLSWVLTGFDDYPFAEERRLFYVALTRTKNRTYLLVPDNRPSLFVKELIEKQHLPYQIIGTMQSVNRLPRCSQCKTGHLVIRKRGHHEFLGCTNYPTCDCTIHDTTILIQPIQCPVCGGYLVNRKGKYGKFYGCSNYPTCKHKTQTVTL